MSVTIAGMILGSALRNMQNAKSRSVAVNIAREGIEAVRNVRDTNWFKYHSKRRDCWNQLPARDPDAQCVKADYIKPGHYIIYRQGGYPTAASDPTYRWRMSELEWNSILPGVDVNHDPVPPCPGGLNFYHNITDGFTYKCNGIIQKWENTALLSLVDINSMVDTDNNGKYDDDSDLYNHMNPDNEDPLNPNNDIPLGKSVKDSIFTRVITIEYIDNQGNIITNPDNYTDDINRMRVTSTVKWISGTFTFKVELVTHLTDYLGREKLSG
jgi:hypothetical protein